MKLIPLTSRKPKKGMQYVLFKRFGSMRWKWECSGVFSQCTNLEIYSETNWTHWAEFKAPKGER